MNKAGRLRSPEQFRHEAVAQVAPACPIRRLEVPVTEPALAETDNLLGLRMAEELDFAWRQLSSLANGIARDGIMAARHGTAVPTLDAVGQVLGQMAAVLVYARARGGSRAGCRAPGKAAMCRVRPLSGKRRR